MQAGTAGSHHGSAAAPASAQQTCSLLCKIFPVTSSLVHGVDEIHFPANLNWLFNKRRRSFPRLKVALFVL